MKERKITRRKSGRRIANGNVYKNRRKTTRRKSIGERRKKNDSWSKEIPWKSRGYG